MLFLLENIYLVATMLELGISNTAMSKTELYTSGDGPVNSAL